MILITGGVKSGKSRKALEIAKKFEKRAFIATGVGFDKEMKERIERHKKERGDDFVTFEEPLKIYEVISRIKDQFDVIVVDCLTTWLGNLFFEYQDDFETIERHVNLLLENLCGKELIVTNEVGLGVIPADFVTRKYVETLGKLNSLIAQRCDEVYLMVCGIGVRIK
ncbi:bifunctional adenosylcobinamide kinase/adenosylcobinamide-phosphate guanylyltransferase [Pseudothermotoga thermarum]|uniref:Adenosylcobinamide kinase n=1 Tax=Pseudothermotoga thermarum DSM 5069 TaxID=688269 RepID=F7YVV7_9THEM|nr:bifunctional adenosylcobinamide kinase/adenosylcobinamide-phosphate guanylyltransferase [Pseudothermotoga thermarum]AEH51779.1 adenosylcobinamide kinase [Pseudothermotoga thermarum DSM 5069]